MNRHTIRIGCLLLVSALFFFSPSSAWAISFEIPSRQDSLRGGNGTHRSWWDVHHYSLSIAFDTVKKAIMGSNVITATITKAPTDSLQIDLQELLFLDSVIFDGQPLAYFKEGNVWWILYPFNRYKIGEKLQLTFYYHGKPRMAKRAPWDGGMIWTKDSMGNAWVSVACQGLGASSWWPCKDYQGDEPDSGMQIQFYIPSNNDEVPISTIPIITNGNNAYWQTTKTIPFPLHQSAKDYLKLTAKVVNPINTYNVTFYYGNYHTWKDTMIGENGVLPLTFAPLYYNEALARKQFTVVKEMLRCFEYWMGPYPFYEDGYKLVEAPFLGMEHQSAIAYGNSYLMGYKGADRSHTGVGMLFDFIIVHESGHEWFGNNITAADIADNWIHEGFTTYTETLFAEWIAGKEKAFEYCRGEWKNIRNDRPIIGDYSVQDEGSGDKYDKGAAVVHMIRMVLNDDEKFRNLLRQMNQDFYHRVVSSQEIETYIIQKTGYNFNPLFNQYLRTTQIPQLEYYIQHKDLYYRFTNIVSEFTLPLEVRIGKHQKKIQPTTEWQKIKWKHGYGVSFSKDFLIDVK